LKVVNEVKGKLKGAKASTCLL